MMALPASGWVPPTQAGVVDAPLPVIYTSHYRDTVAVQSAELISRTIEGMDVRLEPTTNLGVVLEQTQVFMALLLDTIIPGETLFECLNKRWWWTERTTL